MNKTYLITGGISVASLAAGAAGGYFFAKKKFDVELEEVVAREVNETKRYYSILLAQARNGEDKPDDPADVLTQDRPEEDEDEEVDPELAKEAQTALTNYQGYSATGDEEAVTTNIFDKSDKGKKKLPPRDPETGHFLPRNGAAKTKEQTPYLIEPDEFLDNNLEHDQDSVLYFANDKTAVLTSDFNEVIDLARLGEVNLTLFPDDEPSVIYVRHEGLGIDYQVTRTFDSLTEAMGFGEDEEDLGVDEEEDEDEESDLHLQH